MRPRNTRTLAVFALALGLAGCDTGGASPGGSSDNEDEAPADEPETLRWLDPTNVFPETLTYSVSEQHDADNCELFVDRFAASTFSNGGATVRWIEAAIQVGAQDGELLNVGMLTRAEAGDGPRDAITLGTLAGPAPTAARTGFTTFRSNPPRDVEVVEFAFFADVERPDGSVVRLWQSQHGDNFDLDEVFAAGTDHESTGGTTTDRPRGESSIFDQRRACQ